MAFSDETSRREPGLSLGAAGFGGIGGGDWIEPEKEPRDWKKLFLILGLGALSWVATYVGMLELIESNMGELPFVHRVIIGFAVAMLMTMIIWLLDQIFSPINFATKAVYIFGYLFLTLISVGFGFGFYWKVLESRGETTRSAEAAISQVQTALHAGSTRIEQLSDTLGQLTELSAAKAIEEREKGTSCPNSSPGDGPRRKLRDADAQKFAFAGDFVKSRADNIRSEISGLDAELTKVVDGSQSTFDPKTGNRNEFMRALNRRLDMTVAGFNAFRSDPQLGQIRSDLAARAEQAVFPNGSGGTFACPDVQLQTALRGVVRAIDHLPVMQRPQVAAVEGPEATVEAFRRLVATLQGALVFDLPPSADELRALQKKAVQSVSGSASAEAAPVLAEPVGLSKRDYIPLAIAVFVDFCLLLVSIGRPINRLSGLVPVMREAERGPMIKILSRFNEIHRDPEIRQNFEIFRHVVFDMHGAYYVAVPLDAPYRPNGRGAQGGFGYSSHDAQELQHEAHLLSNLFSGFEQQKIFSRVYNPFLTTKAIQKKLWRQGSKFAGCQAFRVYRFRNGAWSDMILQAVMGAARRAEEQRYLRMKAVAEAAAVSPANAGHAANGRDPLQGLDTGLKLAPDVDDGRNASGFSTIHPTAGNGANRAGTNGTARRWATTTGHSVNGGSGRAKRRRTARPAEGAVRNGHDEHVLRSAFGRYAPSAAAEFSTGVNGTSADGDDEDDGLEPATIPANANTSPSEQVADTTDKRPGEAAATPKSASANDVVISLSDKRQGGVAAAEVEFVATPEPQPQPASSPQDEQPPLGGSSAENEPQTTVTLTRETATFAVPVSDGRVTSVLAAAEAVDSKSALSVVEDHPATPPPLPARVDETASKEAGDGVQGPANTTGKPAGDRWDLTASPIDLEDDETDDPTIITIAQRLRPESGNSGV